MKWPRINPGDLARHTLKFYSRTITKSEDAGSDTSTWDMLFVTLGGKLNPTEGRKFFDANRLVTERLTVAMVRRVAGYDLDETMQMEFNGRRYEILEIRDEEEMDVKLYVLLRELE